MDWNTLFTLPSNRAYSSRTSCSRSETRGFEARRRGFSGVVGWLLLLLSGAVGVGVLVSIEEGMIVAIEWYG